MQLKEISSILDVTYHLSVELKSSTWGLFYLEIGVEVPFFKLYDAMDDVLKMTIS